MLWSCPGRTPPPLDRVVAQLPYADALVHVQSDFSIYGPGLSTVRPGNLIEWKDFGACWTKPARALVKPVPYWPYMLRIPTLIAAGKAGAPPVPYPTIPEIDTTPLLRLATTLLQDDIANQALLYMVRIMQLRSTTSNEHRGTVLTCAQLEAARDGRPFPGE